MLSEKALPPAGLTIKQLLWLCGGKKEVAKACGLSRLSWTTVPDKHVVTVSKLAKLPIETVRPDLAGAADVYRAREAAQA